MPSAPSQAEPSRAPSPPPAPPAPVPPPAAQPESAADAGRAAERSTSSRASRTRRRGSEKYARTETLLNRVQDKVDAATGRIGEVALQGDMIALRNQSGPCSERVRKIAWRRHPDRNCRCHGALTSALTVALLEIPSGHPAAMSFRTLDDAGCEGQARPPARRSQRADGGRTRHRRDPHRAHHPDDPRDRRQGRQGRPPRPFRAAEGPRPERVAEAGRRCPREASRAPGRLRRGLRRRRRRRSRRGR